MEGIYEQILEWSQDKPQWLQDALRRLIEQEEISDADKAELLRLCLQQVGLPSDEPPITASPLTEEHIPDSESAETTVTLASLGEMHGINKIDEEASIIFAPSGLTVIYGDNGAGKSGYTRILKKLCRARGRAGAIHPNVYAAAGEVEQSALITYSVDGTEMTHTWEEAAASPASLSAVSVFDSHTAIAQVSSQNELAYQPMGLDLLSRTAELGVELGDRIRSLITAEERAADSFGDFNHENETRQKLLALSKVDPTKIAEEFSFTEEEVIELAGFQKKVSEIKSADTTKEIAKLQTQYERVEYLKRHIVEKDAALSNDALSAIIEAKEDRDTKGAAVAVASQKFEDAPVDGSGGATWKLLWEAARRFYIEAYPGKNYPVDDDIVCVLCQQPLSDAAASRLNEFEAFVRTDTQRQYDEAERVLARTAAACQVEVNPRDILLVVSDIAETNEKLAAKIRQTIMHLSQRVTTAASLLQNECSLLAFDSDASVLAEIDSEVLAAIDAKIKEYEKHAADQTAIRPLEKRIEDLSDKQRASQSHERIERELMRQKRLAKLQEAQRLVNTTAITLEANRLAGEITDTLVQTFADEVNVIDVGNELNIELSTAGGRRGVALHQIQLSTAHLDIPVLEVLSEGELRAIALAGFLTEISMSPAGSAVVFDDPVSSLDHKRKTKIAKRIVDEARSRQVVVFTHDLAFALELDHYSNKAPAIQTQFITIDPAMGERGAGVSHEGMPWDGMSTSRRIRKLNADIQTAEALHNRGQVQEYNTAIGSLYVNLRQSWERAIEEILFNGSVKRFSRAIETQRVARVDIIEGDYPIIEANMEICNTYAHDQAPEVGTVYPTPTEVRAHIAALRTWTDSIEARRRIN